MLKCKKCGGIIPIRAKRNRSGYCRHCYIYAYQKKKRLERRKNKCCIICGDKVKPKKVYPCRCEKCYERDFGKLKRNHKEQ